MCALQLAAPQDSVSQGTSTALRRLIRDCVTESMVTQALGGVGPRGLQPPLVSCVAAVAGALGTRYQDGWPLALTGMCG